MVFKLKETEERTLCTKRLRQGGPELGANMDYLAASCLKERKKAQLRAGM